MYRMMVTLNKPRNSRSCRARFGAAVLTMLCLFSWTPLGAQEPEKLPPAAEPAQEDDAALDDLGKKLVRKVFDDSEEDVMTAMIRLMGESAERLEVDFDCGEETQDLQRRVMEELDSAIKEAAARRRRTPPSSQSASSDKRQRPGTPQPGGKSKNEGEGKEGDASADAAGVSVTQLTDAAKAGGELKESRRAWGNLPPRERDEVIQGAAEDSLERYRQWIEQYYRALQESPE